MPNAGLVVRVRTRVNLYPQRSGSEGLPFLPVLDNKSPFWNRLAHEYHLGRGFEHGQHITCSMYRKQLRRPIGKHYGTIACRTERRICIVGE